MIKTDIIDQIAYELYRAEQEVCEINKFVERYPELNLAIAYEIQDKLISIKCQKENTVISGHKLGLTSKAKQEMMGVHEPSYGVLLESMKIDESKTISVKPFIHAKIEPEIAFVFKKDIKGPFVSIDAVLEATDYITPAMEIIDSRYKNFNFTLIDVIADNSSSSRYILGSEQYKVDEVDLELMGCVFKKNGEIYATSAAGSIMGNPARAIAWMANKLIARGQCIKAGEVVLSGALTGAESIAKNDQFTVSFDGIGSLEVSFTE